LDKVVLRRKVLEVRDEFSVANKLVYEMLEAVGYGDL